MLSMFLWKNTGFYFRLYFMYFAWFYCDYFGRFVLQHRSKLNEINNMSFVTKICLGVIPYYRLMTNKVFE